MGTLVVGRAHSCYALFLRVGEGLGEGEGPALGVLSFRWERIPSVCLLTFICLASADQKQPRFFFRNALKVEESLFSFSANKAQKKKEKK